MQVEQWLRSDIGILQEWARSQKCPVCSNDSMSIEDLTSLAFNALHDKYNTHRFNGWQTAAIKALGIPYSHLKVIESPTAISGKKSAYFESIEKVCDDLGIDRNALKICDPQYTNLHCYNCRMKIPAYEYLLLKNGIEIGWFNNVERLKRSTKWLHELSGGKNCK